MIPAARIDGRRDGDRYMDAETWHTREAPRWFVVARVGLLARRPQRFSTNCATRHRRTGPWYCPAMSGARHLCACAVGIGWPRKCEARPDADLRLRRKSLRRKY